MLFYLIKIFYNIVLLITSFSFGTVSFRQDEYDEISVFLEVPQVGGSEISSVISGNDLFLPVTDLFDFLKIRNLLRKDGIGFRFLYKS